MCGGFGEDPASNLSHIMLEEIRASDGDCCCCLALRQQPRHQLVGISWHKKVEVNRRE